MVSSAPDDTAEAHDAPAWRVWAAAAAVVGVAAALASSGGPAAAPAPAGPAADALPDGVSPLWAQWDAANVDFVVAGLPEAGWAESGGAAGLFAARYPALVRGCPAARWPAATPGGERQWTAEYLSRHAAEFRGVRVKRGGVEGSADFLYHADLANKTELDLGWRPAFTEHNLTAADFFRLCDGGPAAAARELGGDRAEVRAGPGGLYFSTHARRLRKNAGGSGAPLLEDLGDDAELYAGVEPPPANPSRHVWAGSGGVSATAHYDAVHNLYVQLHGQKRFILLPPYADRVLYPYPRLHPSARHTQVNFSAPDPRRFPDFFGRSDPRTGAPLPTLLHAYDVVLRPGDVLYVPPYWLHHASAVTTSVSVSLWSDAEELQAMKDAVAAPVPLRRGLDDASRRAAYVELVVRFARRWHQLVRHAAGQRPELWDAMRPPSPRGLVERVVRSRYGPLRPGAGAGAGEGEEDAEAAAAGRRLETCRLDPARHADLVEALEKRAREAAVQVTRLGRAGRGAAANLADMRRADFRAVAEIHAADFVESVLQALVGTRGVRPFLEAMLRDCGPGPEF